MTGAGLSLGQAVTGCDQIGFLGSALVAPVTSSIQTRDRCPWLPTSRTAGPRGPDCRELV